MSFKPKWGFRIVTFCRVSMFCHSKLPKLQKFSRRNIALAVLVLTIVVLSHGKPPQPEDIGTNFFLKASKSVPRIGRRTMEYENYFLKASKSIPRIGRRTLTSSTEADNNGGWFPLDLEPIKRSFFEKYFKENEQPVWNDLEKIYQDYPGAIQGDEPYTSGGINPKPNSYWPRTKKNDEMEDQPQNHE